MHALIITLLHHLSQECKSFAVDRCEISHRKCSIHRQVACTSMHISANHMTFVFGPVIWLWHLPGQVHLRQSSLTSLCLRCCFGSLHYSRHTTGFPAVPKIAPPNGKRFDFSVEHFASSHVSLTRRHPLRLTSADEASFQIELSVMTTLSADASFAISPRNIIVNGSLMTIHGRGVGGVNKTHWSLVGLGYESWEPLINLFQTNVRDRDSTAKLKTERRKKEAKRITEGQTEHKMSSELKQLYDPYLKWEEREKIAAPVILLHAAQSSYGVFLETVYVKLDPSYSIFSCPSSVLLFKFCTIRIDHDIFFNWRNREHAYRGNFK